MLKDLALFFRSRGFKLISINKIINDIAKTPRQTLFKSQNDTNTNLLLASRKSSRIPFVTTWHHKLSGFQSILHLHYRQMIEQFPNLKCIFPEAPILSFRCNKNLRNQLVHTSLTIGTQKALNSLVTALLVYQNEVRAVNFVHL